MVIKRIIIELSFREILEVQKINENFRVRNVDTEKDNLYVEKTVKCIEDGANSVRQ